MLYKSVEEQITSVIVLDYLFSLDYSESYSKK